MFNLSSQEILIILVIALIVVGPQRLPELSRSIGKGLRELRKVQDDVKDMVKLDLEPDRPKRVSRPSSPTAPGVHRTPKPAPASSAPPQGAPATQGEGTPTSAGSSAADPPTTPPVDDAAGSA
jgi:Tat protein translocase TatB subunit